MRQTEPRVRGYAVTHPVGEVTLPTQSGWDYVIYAKAGLFAARDEANTWVVPSHRALCVADGARLRVVTRAPTVMRCLYLSTALEAGLAGVRVITVGPLTRELLVHAAESCPLDRSTRHEALVTLLVDQLRSEATAPLHLPQPVDERAKRLANAIVGDPAASLDTLTAEVAASRRTLERLFTAETSMTLASWQRRARVLAAVALMSGGDSVTDAATAVGYATPSSFVTAFRSELDTTPRRFIDGG